jgi:hypothetical protein
VELLDGGRAADCSTMMFCKSHSSEAVALARRAIGDGRTVIYDICDNPFLETNTKPQNREKQHNIETLLRLAKLVVCSSPTLAQQLFDRLPELRGRLKVIPDYLEEYASVRERPAMEQRISLFWLKRFLKAHKGALKFVWFGNSKRGLTGIDRLGEAVARLAAIETKRPKTLTIIGDRPQLYREHAVKWPIPHVYHHWSLATFSEALRLHDVAIIPVEQTSYTLGKTINRPATAILAGLGVIADPLPAYEELAPYVFVGRWEEGIREYDRRLPREDSRIPEAEAYLRRTYASDIIDACWVDVLSGFTNQPDCENLRAS